MTNSQIQRYTKDWREHNKTMKQKHMHFMVFKNFDDYILYRFGKKKTKTEKAIKSFTPKYNYRETTPVHSLTESGSVKGNLCNTSKKESLQYSGEHIVGIAQMHKSNATTVSKETDPAIFARMRR